MPDFCTGTEVTFGHLRFFKSISKFICSSVDGFPGLAHWVSDFNADGELTTFWDPTHLYSNPTTNLSSWVCLDAWTREGGVRDMKAIRERPQIFCMRTFKFCVVLAHNWHNKLVTVMPAWTTTMSKTHSGSFHWSSATVIIMWHKFIDCCPPIFRSPSGSDKPRNYSHNIQTVY